MKLKKIGPMDTLYVMSSLTHPRQKVTAKVLTRMHRGMGFSNNAVHFVIERDGTAVQTRALDLPGLMAGKHNASALQVCLIGGVDLAGEIEVNFAADQLASLDRIVAENSDLKLILDTHSLPKGVFPK